MPSIKKQHIRPFAYMDAAKQEIDQTGYTWEELAKVEYAFERNDHGISEKQRQFNGLVAVLNVLRDIHEVDQPEHSGSHTKLKAIATDKFNIELA